MRHISKFLILFLLIGILSAASINQDSILNVVESKSGIEKIDERLEFAFLMRNRDYKVCMDQAKIAFKEAQAIGDKNRMGTSYYYMGLAYYYVPNADSALSYFNLAEKTYRETGNEKDLGRILSFIGTTHLMRTGNQEKALEYYYESIPYCLENDNYRILGSTYSSIGNIFRMNSAYENALDWIIKAREFYRKAEYEEGIAWIQYSMGRLYKTMNLNEDARKAFLKSLELYRKLAKIDGNTNGVSICLDQLSIVYLDMNDFEKAKEYNKMALKNYAESSSKYGISNCYKNYGKISYYVGNHEESIKYLERSLDIKKDINDVLGMPGLYELLGKNYTQMNDYQRAIDSLEVGLDIAVSSKQQSLIMIINGSLSDAYYKLGNYKIAHAYKSRQLEIFENTYNSKSTRNMVQLNAIYEIEKKQEQIRKLEQQNTVNEIRLQRDKSIRTFMILIIFLILFILALLIYFYTTKQRSNKELKQRNKELGCLYNFYKLLENEKLDDHVLFSKIVNLIPPAMQFSKKTSVRLSIYGSDYLSDSFKESESYISSPVIINHEIAGNLEVFYCDLSISQTKDPFLKEEKDLINVLGKRLGASVESRQNQRSLFESENQLRELNATKDKFFSIIAHDLRSPYNSILGFSNILSEYSKMGKMKEVSEFSKMIHEAAQRSFDLLNNLLEWSRSQTNTIQYKPERINLKESLSNVVKLMNNSAEEKSLHITTSIPDIRVMADSNMLEAVLRNLLSNAIKYSYKNGVVQISAEKKDGEILVRFRDNGTGIKEENISKLFHMEDNIITSGTDNEKGTGLGLIICKEFVEKHNGRIWAENNPDRGTSFYFTIPESD